MSKSGNHLLTLARRLWTSPLRLGPTSQTSNYPMFSRHLAETQQVDPLSQLEQTNDFASISESLKAHEEDVERGVGRRGFVTRDARTLEIYRQFIQDHPWLSKLKYTDPPNKGDARETRVVHIKNICDQPKYLEKHDSIPPQIDFLAVGGPAAESAVFMKSALEGTAKGNKFVTYDPGEANAAWSAMQLHSRHGTALNADPSLTGHRLLWAFSKRSLLRLALQLSSPLQSTQLLLKEYLQPDYLKINLSPRSLRLNDCKIYLENEYLWLCNTINKFLGRHNLHDCDRAKSIDSQRIYRYIEKATGLSLTSFCKTDEMTALHFALTEEERLFTERENKDLLERSGIVSREVNDNPNLKKLSPEPDKIFGTWGYAGDGISLFSASKEMGQYVNERGGQWHANAKLKSIFIDTRSEPKLAGVEYISKKGKIEFVSVKSAFITLGYKARFKYHGRHPGLFSTTDNPLPPIGIASGCSIVAIFQKNQAMKDMIADCNCFPQFSAKNAHWSLIAETETHCLIRITGGGNMGQETYPPAYFINLIATTRRIFGSALIGIVSTNACPRVLNAENSGRFVRLAKDIVISYGKGGTGVTQRCIEALAALHFLGRKNITQKIKDQLPGLMTQYNFDNILTDATQQTEEKIGYRV